MMIDDLIKQIAIKKQRLLALQHAEGDMTANYREQYLVATEMQALQNEVLRYVHEQADKLK